jgi:hypothetical protein
LFGIELPFVPACGPHADDADAFTPEPCEYDNDGAADVDADRDPALAGVVGRKDKRRIEKRFIEIGEIQPVFFEVGQALRFVPNNFHSVL